MVESMVLQNQAIFNSKKCDGNNVLGFIDKQVKDWSQARREEDKEITRVKNKNQIIPKAERKKISSGINRKGAGIS